MISTTSEAPKRYRRISYFEKFEVNFLMKQAVRPWNIHSRIMAFIEVIAKTPKQKNTNNFQEIISRKMRTIQDLKLS